MSIGHPLINRPIVLKENDLNTKIHNINIASNLSINISTSSDSKLETGGSIWHAGFALSQYLVNNAYLVKDKVVVEIGAGCGLPGITAAALGAKIVILTDMSEQMDVLQRNIRLNRHLYSANTIISCIPLMFGETIDDLYQYLMTYNIDLYNLLINNNSDNTNEFEVILAADVGYDLELHPLLVKTIKSILKPIYFSCSNNSNNKDVDKDKENSSSSSGKIALLVEEIRWKDIYTYFKDELTNNSISNADTWNCIEKNYKYYQHNNNNNNNDDDNNNNNNDNDIHIKEKELKLELIDTIELFINSGSDDSMQNSDIKIDSDISLIDREDKKILTSVSGCPIHLMYMKLV